MIDLLQKSVRHTGILGTGTIIAQEEKYITVEFKNKTSIFSYPIAFEKFLVMEDSNLQEQVVNEIKLAKEVEAAKKAEEATKRAEEEQKRLEELKSKSQSSKKQSIEKAYVPASRVPGQALTYLVFQGDTYNEEMQGQFIWAPKYSKAGGTMHHWDRLMDIQEGDVLFHSSDGYIKAVSRAKGPCQESARPDLSTGNWDQWEKTGRRVDCDYHTLQVPLKHGDYKEEILKYCNVKYAPFDKDGNGNMGYLFDLNPDLASFFIKEIAKKNPEMLDLEFLRFLLVRQQTR